MNYNNNSAYLPQRHEIDREFERTTSTEWKLGNPDLPISNYREEIMKAVDENQVLVLTAETGAGKSTQIPQFLVEDGYEVVMTQPRVVAARGVSDRVRNEMVSALGEDATGLVGYRTARERNDSDTNKVRLVTDGLQIVRELAGNGTDKKQVLVLDEVHEWNENMEVLVAWAKQRLKEDPHFKVVSMSATMDAEKLAQFFSDDNTRTVPVIEVPGRTFEVEKSEGGDVAERAIKFAEQGKNTLVFVPGKREIQDAIEAISRANVEGVTVLPLHGQLDKEEQQKVFEKYDGPKIIVATDVAQTSITIDDIDAVVDSGYRRENRLVNGVEGLYLVPISQADCMQRAGRAGRTKKGEYVLAELPRHRFIPFKERSLYGTPEILRTRLDGTVLRLAKNNLDAGTLDFYHQPNKQEILASKRRLVQLGALTDSGNVTRIGREIDAMPVESHYARMMIEARKYSRNVRTQLAAMVSTVAAGRITFSGRRSDERWRELISDQCDSDMISQLEVYIATQRMSFSERKDFDIANKRYDAAQDTFDRIRQIEDLGGSRKVKLPTSREREQLVKCIIAGSVDNLYVGSYGTYRKGEDERWIGNRSLVGGADMVVGKPFDLQIGGGVNRLLEDVTRVPSQEVLREVAPQLFELQRGEPYYSHVLGGVAVRESAQFNGAQLSNKEASADVTPENLELFWRHIIDEAWSTVKSERMQLQHRVPAELPVVERNEIAREVIAVVSGIISKQNFTDEQREIVMRAGQLGNYYGFDTVAQIENESPNTLPIGKHTYNLTYTEGQPYMREPSEHSEVRSDFLANMPAVLADGREVKVRSSYGTEVELNDLWLRDDSAKEYRMKEAWRRGEATEQIERVEMEPGVWQVELGMTDYYEYPIRGFVVDTTVRPSLAVQSGERKFASQLELYTYLRQTEIYKDDLQQEKARQEEERQQTQIREKFRDFHNEITNYDFVEADDTYDISDELMDQVDVLSQDVGRQIHIPGTVAELEVSYRDLNNRYRLLKDKIKAYTDSQTIEGDLLESLKGRFNRY